MAEVKIVHVSPDQELNVLQEKFQVKENNLQINYMLPRLYSDTIYLSKV